MGKMTEQEKAVHDHEQHILKGRLRNATDDARRALTVLEQVVRCGIPNAASVQELVGRVQGSVAGVLARVEHLEAHRGATDGNAPGRGQQHAAVEPAPSLGLSRGAGDTGRYRTPGAAGQDHLEDRRVDQSVSVVVAVPRDAALAALVPTTPEARAAKQRALRSADGG